MAGDWIKMRAALCTHPKVIRIAEIISDSTEIGRRLSTGFNGALSEIVTSDVTRDVTLASLLRVWCATNEHTDDGVWRNSTLRTIDAAAGVPGFGEAMEAVGWAVYDEQANTVTLPDFLENNAPAKRGARSTAAERQARYRAKKAASGDVTRDVTRDVTSNAREEKRKSNTPLPPKGESAAPPGFAKFWSSWPKSTRKGGKAACLKAWARGRLEAQADAIVAHVASMAQSTEWRKNAGEFIPAPLVYLNQSRWDGAEAGFSPASVEWAGAL